MNRHQLLATMLVILEDISQTMYNQHGMSSASNNSVKVDMYGSADTAVVPIILLQDGSHMDIPNNQSITDGKEFDQDGNLMGARYTYPSEGDMTVIVRHQRETDAVRLIGAIRDRLRRFGWETDSIDAYIPEAFGLDVTRPQVTDFDVGESYQKEVEHRSANDVHQEALDVTVTYIDRLVDPDVDVLDSIGTDYSTNDGPDDHLTVDETGRTYES